MSPTTTGVLANVGDRPVQEVADCYYGSNGAATRKLNKRLEGIGSEGRIAAELLRASKASDRAKVYRGGVGTRGSYRSLAYERKENALAALCAILEIHGVAIGMRWGWELDTDTPEFAHVLYVDLPTGQVSFHAPVRGKGPDYAGQWDGQPGQSANRIIAWAASLIEREPSTTANSK